MGGARSFFF
uniref:Uncharacterized protein n=1 Tax=Arundo donax TaxID=35708 RepID=A0A0A9AWU3_ARUDO